MFQHKFDDICQDLQVVAAMLDEIKEHEEQLLLMLQCSWKREVELNPNKSTL